MAGGQSSSLLPGIPDQSSATEAHLSREFAQTLVDAARTLKRALLTVKLYREKSRFCVVYVSAKTVPWMPKPNHSPSLILRLSAYR